VVFWTGLLSESEHGRLRIDEEIFADICFLDPERYQEVRQLFLRFKLIQETEEGGVQITNWEKHQFSASYQRVKRHRERETKSNADVTEVKQNVTVDIDTDTQTDRETGSNGAAVTSRYTASQKGETPAPQAFEVTTAMREWAASKSITVDLEAETEMMLDHYRGTGETRTLWIATWRNWIRKAQRYAAARTGRAKRPNTEADIKAQGERLGVHPQMGESWEDYRQRVYRAGQRGRT